MASISPSSQRAFIVASIMASMFMVAIEATIVSTAMPHIVAELGGLAYYSWVFASFLLAQTATTVIAGKLADVYGRKPVMLVGIVVFVTGSLLGGFAWSMFSIIVFRVVQGIGAGVVQPAAMTIVADLYPAAERGKIQGHLASVWAFSAVAGPLVGGFIVDDLSWPWVFWINVPVGIAAAAGFARYLDETVEHRARAVDVAGSLLFTIAVGSLMFALGETGTVQGIARLAAPLLFVAAGALFLAHERKAPDPIVSLRLWARRPILAANGVVLLASVALMGLTTFLPMYVQVVLGRSPVIAGLALTMTILGWPIGATLAPRLFNRFGIRTVLVAGSLFLPAGGACFALLGDGAGVLQAGIGSAIMGFGMGIANTCAIVLIQDVVERSERGSITASNLFARNLGSTLGATLLGAVVNLRLARSPAGGIGHAEELKRLIGDPGAARAMDGSLLHALADSMHWMFLAMFAVTIVLVGVALLVPDVTLKPRGSPVS
jgi:EmrB/QacA subfamily drug resistance transporter